jgi:hypothetical protein
VRSNRVKNFDVKLGRERKSMLKTDKSLEEMSKQQVVNYLNETVKPEEGVIPAWRPKGL